jgi:hypothetical protein
LPPAPQSTDTHLPDWGAEGGYGYL